jgi:hypothetical protein
VLPARFDDTPLPGVLSDMVVIDLGGRTPQQFAAMIAAKLASLGIVTSVSPPVPQATARSSASGAKALPTWRPRRLHAIMLTRGQVSHAVTGEVAKLYAQQSQPRR